jgi:hypothetical protein
MQAPIAAVLAARRPPLSSDLMGLRQQPARKGLRWQFGWPPPRKALMACWRALRACALSAFVS